jgi:hypothetical protein
VTAALDVDTGDFAILDQVDAALIGPPREAPGHRVVPRGAAAGVVEAAEDREACLSKSRYGTILRTPSVSRRIASSPWLIMALPRRA